MNDNCIIKLTYLLYLAETISGQRFSR